MVSAKINLLSLTSQSSLRISTATWLEMKYMHFVLGLSKKTCDKVPHHRPLSNLSSHCNKKEGLPIEQQMVKEETETMFRSTDHNEITKTGHQKV